MTDPFEELETAENLLKQTRPSHDADLDYNQLKVLLTQERVLDHCRIKMFEKYKYGSSQAKDYVFREHMVRHQISEFALQLSKEVTDRLTGVDPVEKSFVAMSIRDRQPYPEPVKKS